MLGVVTWAELLTVNVPETWSTAVGKVIPAPTPTLPPDAQVIMSWPDGKYMRRSLELPGL